MGPGGDWGGAATRKLKEVERGLLLASVPPPLLLSPSSQLGLENRPSSKRLENREERRGKRSAVKEEDGSIIGSRR